MNRIKVGVVVQSYFSSHICLFFAIFRYNVRTNRPVLTEYMERIKQELSPHYEDVHHIVYGVQNTFKGKVPENRVDFNEKLDLLYASEKKS